MSNKLSEKLNSFPKNHQLNQETKLKIKTILQEEIVKKAKPRKRITFLDYLKKLTIPVSALSVVALAVILLLSSEQIDLFQLEIGNSSGNNPGVTPKDENYEKINELSIVWAEGVKIPDGKERLEMLSEDSKGKFEQEQINRGGENLNIINGELVDYEIEIDGMNVEISYISQTSEPNYYHTKETLTFVKDNEKLLVEEYALIFDNVLFGYDELQYFLSDLKSELISAIALKTGLENEEIAIMIDGGIVNGVYTGMCSVGIPKDANVDESTIHQIIKDTINSVSDSKNIIIIEENITINVERY